MTFRVRSTVRRRRTHHEQEERQQFLVTAGFIGLIALAVLLLGGAVAAGYYNDHLRPVARVAGAEISADALGDRERIESFRINQASARLREARSAGLISEDTYQFQLSQLQQQQTDPLTELIDLTLVQQLAREEGVTVSSADVDAALQADAMTPERRRVDEIVIAPEDVAPGAEPTAEQLADAERRAEAALQELESGTEFAQVAVDYSAAPSAAQRGELGAITEDYPTEPLFLSALFDLEEPGTTGIIEGVDGIRRIGRVREILAAQEDPDYLADIEAEFGLGTYRAALEREQYRTKMEERLIAQATQGSTEQVRVSEIHVESADVSQDPSAAEGEVSVAHILFSPNDDPGAAADINPDDPAWIEAEEAANAANETLRAIDDREDREARFAEIAQAESDDNQGGPDNPGGSAAQGGDLGFVTRGSVVPAFGDAIFDGDHEAGDIIGPVKTDFGYHMILFQERKPPPAERIAEIVQALEEDPDQFAALARERSDAPSAADGGDIGWVTQYQVDAQVYEAVSDLQPGEISEQVSLADGFHVYAVTDRQQRPLDARQRALVELRAFDAWYGPRRAEAEEAGRIERLEEDAGTDPAVPDDFGEQLPDDFELPPEDLLPGDDNFEEPPPDDGSAP